MGLMAPRHQQHIPLAIVYTLVAAFCLALMSFIVKLIGDRATTDMIIFFRFFVCLVLILPWFFKNPKETIHVVKPGKLIFRSMFTFLAMSCFFYAVRQISLTDALLMNNTYPLFVPIVTAILVKTKTSYKIWCSIVLGFCGLAFILKPDASFFTSGGFIALGSGVFGAVAIVLIRLMTKASSVLQILFYNFLIGTIVAAIFLPWNWMDINQEIVVLLILVGLIGLGYQFFSTLAFAKAPVRITSPLMFFSVIFGTFGDYLYWNVEPDLFTLLGMGLIILGGSLTIYFGQKEFTPHIKS
jgi:drug/metabolite transporter (DMT)-like permease